MSAVKAHVRVHFLLQAQDSQHLSQSGLYNSCLTITVAMQADHNVNVAEESVAKKLTSVKTAKQNAQMYFSILIYMVGK